MCPAVPQRAEARCSLKPAPRLLLFAAILLQIHARSLVIEHATLIDATGAPPRRDVSIAIDGGRITRIEKKIAPGRSFVINAKGKFVIPGLWDMHVHIGAA